MQNDAIEMLTDEIVYFFKNNNCPDQESKEMASALMEQIAHNLSGITIYIPRLMVLQKRNAQMVKEFNGRNQRELAKRYDVSLMTVYNVLSAARQKEVLAV